MDIILFTFMYLPSITCIHTMTSLQSSQSNYCKKHIPDTIWKQLEAGAFESLIQHLQERSDEVQNMDLMTISGFCRNCLAKWLVVEARKMAYNLQDQDPVIVNALNGLGYDEAAEEVYGCGYKEWKKRYAKKASDEQMQKFQDSSSIHAKHDKELLKKKPMINNIPSSLMSNVCCEDVEVCPAPEDKTHRSYQAPLPPLSRDAALELKVGILTVSDRAATNQYVTGDLSGPAVEKALYSSVDKLVAVAQQHEANRDTISIVSCKSEIVPDDFAGKAITLWSKPDDDASAIAPYNLIFTTGGTGFSLRDLTPEATAAFLDCECKSLMV